MAVSTTQSPDNQHHQKSLEITKDDKFFSRLLSKEANPSFRVYYGGIGGKVPFLWESEPGTPKHTFNDKPLLPLTPPPSYHYFNSPEITKSPVTSKSKFSRQRSNNNLLHFLFPSTSLLKRSNVENKYQLSNSAGRSRGSSCDSRVGYDDDDEDPAVGSPTSTLCSCIGK